MAMFSFTMMAKRETGFTAAGRFRQPCIGHRPGVIVLARVVGLASLPFSFLVFRCFVFLVCGDIFRPSLHSNVQED